MPTKSTRTHAHTKKSNALAKRQTRHNSSPGPNHRISAASRWVASSPGRSRITHSPGEPPTQDTLARPTVHAVAERILADVLVLDGVVRLAVMKTGVDASAIPGSEVCAAARAGRRTRHNISFRSVADKVRSMLVWTHRTSGRPDGPPRQDPRNRRIAGR